MILLLYIELGLVLLTILAIILEAKVNKGKILLGDFLMIILMSLIPVLNIALLIGSLKDIVRGLDEEGVVLFDFREPRDKIKKSWGEKIE